MDGQGHDDGEHDRDHAHGHDLEVDKERGLLAKHLDGLTRHHHGFEGSVDRALETSARGVTALKISLLGLAATAVFQLVIVLVSGSVALLADTVHNFADALTAVPLWIAFVVGRRAANRSYTYGYGRAEDLAGVFVIAMIALSAAVAAWESVQRLLQPQPIHNVGWVIVAGVVGFLGNEAVAIYRIRIGKGSAPRRLSPTGTTPAPTASRRSVSCSAPRGCCLVFRSRTRWWVWPSRSRSSSC